MPEDEASNGRSERRRGRPRLRDAPDPREVERHALRFFAAKGFEGASIRDIAFSSGVDPALVSRRFGSKLELWKATVDGIAQQLGHAYENAMEKAPGTPAYEDRLQAMMRSFIALNCALPELGRFFIDEIALPGERRDYILERIWRPFHNSLQPLLEEGARRGVLRIADTDFGAVALLGIVVMPQLLAPILQREMEHPQGEAFDRIMASVTAFLGIEGRTDALGQ